MTGKASSKLEMPYLQAIQSVPGDTAGEKLSWIGKLASCEDEVIGELDKLPPKLQPLLEVETAIKYQRYENIASALKSNDWTIVKRALKAVWFFDGNHMIVDVEYFRTHIFPYISLLTRTRLVRTFVRRIKSSAFAQEMFAALEQNYDYRTALPLIACCDDDFVYDTVVKSKRMLPLGIFKKIFRRNLDLGVRLLKSFIFDCHEYALIDKKIVKNDPCDIIERYKPFLSLLPKSRPMDFVDIVETVAHTPNIKVMSNKCAKKFLHKAEKQVAEYPHLYMPILPPKAINSGQMELMFPALMKYYHDSFDTDLMLDYLKDYPKDRKFALLCKTFKDVYHDELLNDTKRVTFKLLKILPSCDRNKQVEIMINNQPSTNVCSHNTLIYHNYICYSSLEVAIPILKNKLNHTKCEEEKVNCLEQIIYACLINEDDNELCKTLRYIENICATLNFALSKLIIDNFLLIFDMRSVYLSKENVILMQEILLSVDTRHKYINELVLEKMLHLQIIHKIPLKSLIYALINSYQHQMSNITFNLLKDYPLYEKQCLVTFIYVLQILYSDVNKKTNENKKYNSTGRKMKKKSTREEKNTVVCRLIVAMYDFNYRCKKSHVRAKLTIKSYPWLMNAVHAIMRSKQDCLFWKEAQDALRKQEREMYYNRIFPNTLTEIADVKSGAAFRLLKRNLQSVQDNWEEYFIYCKRNYNSKQVQNFVRVIRWYEDVPIKFAKQCMDHLHRKVTNEKSVLILLSILLHSNTMQKLMDSYTTVKKDSSNHNRFISHFDICMKYLNPPLPLKFFINKEIFNKSYLSTTLMMLRSVSRRSSLSQVILFSDNFENMNVQMRKQWIDLMYSIVPTNYFVTFLEEIWSVERHRSIRQLLLNTVQRLLCERPREETWALCCRIFLGLSVKDEQLFWKMKDYIENISDTYSEAYFNLWFDTINALNVAGLSDERTKQHTEKCLKHLYQYIKSEKYVEHIFRRLFFCSNISIVEAVRSFAIKYLLKLNNDKLARYSKLIFKIFFFTISNSWNVSHPADRFYYPIRGVVHSYFEQFIIAYMRKRKNQYFDGSVLDDMLLIFSTVLTPEQDIQSYLLLVYAKKLHAFSYVTPIENNDFGLQLGQIIPDLIDKLSHYMIDFMAMLLNYFLRNIYSSDQHSDVIFHTISGLIDANNTYSNFMAIMILSLQKYYTKYYPIISRALNTFSHHSINAIVLYHYLNNASFDDVPLNDESDSSENIN